MKKLKLPVSLAILAMAVSVQLKAQTGDSNTDSHNIIISIPTVAILDIEPSANKNINMNFTAPTEAGNPITVAATNTSLYLNYSTIKSVATKTLRISVKLDNAPTAQGVDIKVTAAAYAGSGAGVFGTPSAQLTLSTAEQTIINGIGSAYTGDGAGNGHNLTYVVTPSTTATYGNLVTTAATSKIVTYTIAEN